MKKKGVFAGVASGITLYVLAACTSPITPETAAPQPTETFTAVATATTTAWPAAATATTPLSTATMVTQPTATTPVELQADDDLTVAWEGDVELSEGQISDFADARSIDLAVVADKVYVALGRNDHISVARSDDNGRTFTPPQEVSPERALVLAVERPAILAGEGGRLYVAWSSPDLNGTIWYTLSEDGGQSFAPAFAISGSPQPETVLTRMTFDDAGNPIIAWLANSTLRLARSTDNGRSFTPGTIADDQTCECCHPQPIVRGNQVLLAYRNLEVEDSGENIRDIFVVSSNDGGQTFDSERRVSDGHWIINACPISGPSLAVSGEMIYASWMDGRNDSQHDFSHTDIWLAVSHDGGQTFSANRRVNEMAGIYNNLPSLAVDSQGRLHIIWEALEQERDVIYYARSSDGGTTFTHPVAVVSSQDGSGRRPGNASFQVDDAHIYLTWVDSVGAHFAVWPNE